MSNARSPREVCSTTIGTSGLIVLALAHVLAFVSLRRPDSSRRLAGRSPIGRVHSRGVRRRSPAPAPRAARRLLGLLRRPQLLARLRLRRAGSAWRASAIRSTAWRAARSSRSSSRRPALRSLLEQLLAARGPRARRSARAPPAAPRSDGLDLLGRDDRGEHRLAAQRQLGLGRHLGEDLLLARARRSAGRPRARCRGGRASAASAPTSPAPAP